MKRTVPCDGCGEPTRVKVRWWLFARLFGYPLGFGAHLQHLESGRDE